MIQTKLLAVFKIYIEFHIKILYYITEKTPIYLIYIFAVSYGLYAPSLSGNNVFRLVCFASTVYILIISGLIHLACKTVYLRKLLSDLVTEDFIVKYLGHFTSTRLAIKTIGPFIGVATSEAFTQLVNNYVTEQQIASITAGYKGNFGQDAENWDKSTKAQHLKECSDFRKSAPVGGLCTQVYKHVHTENMTKEVLTGANEFFNGKRK